MKETDNKLLDYNKKFEKCFRYKQQKKASNRNRLTNTLF